MKKLLITAIASLLGLGAHAARTPQITNVEPPHWWVGMACDTLQIMVTGPGIAETRARVDWPGVKLIEQVNPGSPNYTLLYLTIAGDTRPGKMPISFAAPGEKAATISYELRARKDGATEHGGFDASDVLYLIMPDRFAEGKDASVTSKGLNYPATVDRDDPNARHGGNIQGIIDRLPYLNDLGVTALWVCPVLENDMPGGSYHGYATTDYYRIDPRLGTNERWRELIDKAHASGLKVVMDMIFNHCGSGHPWLKDMPSADWLNVPDGSLLTNFRLSTLHDPYVSDYDRRETVDGWFVPAMPDLNQRNPHLMKYLTQNSIWWIEESGIDGIRMDTYPYADATAMAGWISDVQREYPNFNIVGECWYDNEGGEAFWQRGSKVNPTDPNLPTIMDFVPASRLRPAFNGATDPWNGLNKVYDHLALDYLYPDPQHILTFLDNHDTDRWLLTEPQTSADLGPWKQALTWLLTTRGIPQLYYGTELLMNGSKEGSDGYVRRDVPGGFPGDTTDNFTAAGRTPLQNEAHDFMRTLLQWRRTKANDVIARGRLKHFMPREGVYTYSRRLDNGREVVVLMNGNDTPVTAHMQRSAETLPIGSTWTDMLTGNPVTIADEMTFGPRLIMILENF